jgi:hypothetical protein
MQNGNVESAVKYMLQASSAFGDRMPSGARRDLAMALLERGLVEAAGRELTVLLKTSSPTTRPAWVNRASCISALEAFERASSLELDSGPPTPYRILAQADVLVERGRAIAAAELLRANRNTWPQVPQNYDAAFDRLMILSRDKDAEVVRLQAVRDEYQGKVPPSIRLALGTALFEAGDARQAGLELDLAVADGMAVDRLELQIAIDLHRRRLQSSGYDTSFNREVTLIDVDKRLVYVAIPKNACTELKTNFVLNSGYRDSFLSSRLPIHDFCGKLVTDASFRKTFLEPNYFRFVVLRDPLRRLVSAYLNKIVRPQRNQRQYLSLPMLEHTIRSAQRLSGVTFDPVRSITFEEFVHFLATADDTECNRHWLPQFRFTGTDLTVYNHVGKVERLQETFDLLSERFHYVWEINVNSNLMGSKRRFTNYSSSVQLPEPHKVLPRDLDLFENNVPLHSMFYTPALIGIVRERFSIDFQLYESA